MNEYLLSIVLGIVEGLTEFLPVSSTAHLKLVEAWLLGSQADSRYWDMYTIVIQLGAVLALPVYFWWRIRKFVSTFPLGERRDRSYLTHPLSLTLLAFVVTALPAYLLTKLIHKHLDDYRVIGAALLIGGVIMWVVDVLCTQPHTDHMEEMSFFQSIWIGACQILSAVFPGTSRSMSTIAAGQIAGMSRASALEFSFFLSMPTMFVATGYTLYKALFPKPGTRGQELAPLHVDTHGWVLLAIGFGVSFIVSLAVVHFFMQWVRRRGFVPFAIYRIVLGTAVLLLVWRGFLEGTSP